MTLTFSKEDWDSTPAPVQESLLSTLKESFEKTFQIQQSTKQLDEIKELLANATVIAAELSRTSPKEDKHAVFVSDTPLSRQVKIAYGLKQNGWKVSLLYKTTPFFNPDKYFYSSHNYSNPMHAIVLASSLKASVIHVFSSWNFDTAYELVKFKPGPIVFDNYDVLGGCVTPELHEQRADTISKEKFCYENSDALCCRSLTLQIIKKKLDYALPSFKLFYPEYCWDSFQSGTKGPKPKLKEGVHVVYVGNCGSSHFHDPDPSGCTDRAFLDTVAKGNVHYHMYPCMAPGSDFKGLFKDYLEYSERNKNFHFHHPVECDELVTELSQYHFGLLIASESVQTKGDKCYNADVFKYHLANKAFDYLDSSLPLILSCGKTIDWIFKRTGAAYIATREKFPQVINELNNGTFPIEELSRNVEAARQSFSVEKQGQRLVRFYEGILKQTRIYTL